MGFDWKLIRTSLHVYRKHHGLKINFYSKALSSFKNNSLSRRCCCIIRSILGKKLWFPNRIKAKFWTKSPHCPSLFPTSRIYYNAAWIYWLELYRWMTEILSSNRKLFELHKSFKTSECGETFSFEKKNSKYFICLAPSSFSIRSIKRCSTQFQVLNFRYLKT